MSFISGHDATHNLQSLSTLNRKYFMCKQSHREPPQHNVECLAVREYYEDLRQQNRFLLRDHHPHLLVASLLYC